MNQCSSLLQNTIETKHTVVGLLINYHVVYSNTSVYVNSVNISCQVLIVT